MGITEPSSDIVNSTDARNKELTNHWNNMQPSDQRRRTGTKESHFLYRCRGSAVGKSVDYHGPEKEILEVILSAYVVNSVYST